MSSVIKLSGTDKNHVTEGIEVGTRRLSKSTGPRVAIRQQEDELLESSDPDDINFVLSCCVLFIVESVKKLKMKLFFLLLVVCAWFVNAGLMNEAKNYAKWELEHQAMKHILPESLGGKSSHHHSQEVASGGMGGGSGIAGALGK